MMTRYILRSLIWLVLAWLVVLCAPQIGKWLGSDYGPTLPLVSLPWDSQRDVHSSVVTLFRAIVVGAIAALMVEPVKFSERRGGKLFYILLLGYQFLLVVDLFRAYAVDWWVWGLSTIGLVRLGTGNWRESTFPLASPWMSLSALLILAALLIYNAQTTPAQPSA